jgi:MoaA/NifB/PqqE/SkfB family radical SAM enzyme
MATIGDTAFRSFVDVRPVAGFERPLDPEQAPAGTYAFVRGTNSPDDGLSRAESLFAIKRECRIERVTDLPYLQCELYFPDKGGSLELLHDERLVDGAELTKGWQHSGVALTGVPSPAQLTLRFRSEETAGDPEILIRSIQLSDNWGRAQRRRLKCHHPFTLLAAFEDFSAYPCCARQWLKGDQRAGNTREQSLSDIWNGPQYQRMRADFLAGEYASSCREDICPLLKGEGQPTEPPPAVIAAINEGRTVVDYGPVSMYHDIDRGCNLECVMCRDAKILPKADNVKLAIDDIKEAVNLGSLEQAWFSGAGEIFIMADVIRLLESDTFSARGVQLAITTNLTHFNEKLWRRIGHNRFLNITVSADGASTEVYEKIRIGAKWAVVEANMRFLGRLQREGQVGTINWNYTVQRENVGDVGKAIALSRELGFDAIRLIGQLGALSRTHGNMFEDHDLAALDTLYDELVKADAFADPRVVTSELGVEDRVYRSFHRRIELAQHIFERRGYVGDSNRRLPQHEWQKVMKLVASLKSDMEQGGLAPPERLSLQQSDFLHRFARAAEDDTGILRRVLTRSRPIFRSAPLESRGVAKWARGLASATETKERQAV